MIQTGLRKIFFGLLIILIFIPSVAVSSEPAREAHPVEKLLGENLIYDVSFLWFKHLAEGTISLQPGDQPGTYLAVMEAKTLGLAAYFTRQRIEKYQTLMEIGPDGLMRPLLHSSHTFKGVGEMQREKRVSYRYDHVGRQVHYKKVRDGRVKTDELVPLETPGPVFDFISVFYNLRLGLFGDLDYLPALHLPTFYRKGVEEIVIEPLTGKQSGDKKFFSSQGQVCKVLLDPSVFKTNGRDVFISFDQKNRLERGIIKNVIGLGDVKGVLRQVPNIAQINN